MKLEIHPDAAKNFDKKAEGLLSEVEARPHLPQVQKGLRGIPTSDTAQLPHLIVLPIRAPSRIQISCPSKKMARYLSLGVELAESTITVLTKQASSTTKATEPINTISFNRFERASASAMRSRTSISSWCSPAGRRATLVLRAGSLRICFLSLRVRLIAALPCTP